MSDVTNYPRQSYYRATLLSAIDSVQTDGIILSKQLEAISGTIYLNLLDVDNVETISCTGQDSNGELTGVTRAVATYSGETATASAHGAGISIVLSDDWNYWKDMVTGLNDKVDVGGDTMTGPLKFSGSSNAGIEPNRLTTAQRTALSLSGTESAIVFDTDLGQYFTWNGSTWSVVSTGTAPAFGSETVAGIVELATASQSGSATSTGETGARLVMPNSLNVTTSAGAADAGKNPVLNVSGFLDPTILNAQTTSTANAVVRGDGSGKIDMAWLPKDVQTFTADGTWTKPTGARFVYVEVLSAGGGGGGGRRATTPDAEAGGAGGGGGGMSRKLFNADDLTSTVTVTVGAGGSGGARVSSGTGNGASGSDGGASSFGSYLSMLGGLGGSGGGVTNKGGTGGRPVDTFASAAHVGAVSHQGATAQTGNVSASSPSAEFGGGAGGNSSDSSTTALRDGGSSINAAGGGGGGAGNNSNERAGGTGGDTESYVAGGGGAGGAAGVGASGTSGGNGSNGARLQGGGGGGSVTYVGSPVSGGSGGDGGVAGGGGGGGARGGSTGTSGSSGDGGDGGRGEVTVWTW